MDHFSSAARNSTRNSKTVQNRHLPENMCSQASPLVPSISINIIHNKIRETSRERRRRISRRRKRNTLQGNIQTCVSVLTRGFWFLIFTVRCVSRATNRPDSSMPTDLLPRTTRCTCFTAVAAELASKDIFVQSWPSKRIKSRFPRIILLHSPHGYGIKRTNDLNVSFRFRRASKRGGGVFMSEIPCKGKASELGVIDPVQSTPSTAVGKCKRSGCCQVPLSWMYPRLTIRTS